MRIGTWPAVMAILAVACGGGAESAGKDAAPDAAALPSGPDPCSLVSQSDVEALMGPLAEPPYRVDNNRRPAVAGEGCFYRARDRRNVTILVDWEDGELGFQMLAGTGASISDILTGYDATTDTLEGNWDKVGAPFGQFIVLKGKTSIQIDPLGSRIGLDGAARLASIAIGRLGSPLDYSGAKATQARAEDTPRSRNPCELVTRQEVEALMGPLLADPTPAEDGSGCEFRTDKKFLNEPVVRKLEVQWTDGFYTLGQERSATGMAAKAMQMHVDPETPTLSREAVGEAEPWDERMTLMPGLITVVKQDVLLKLPGDGVFGFDEEKALKLLRIAVGRL
ncbi:MAG TPA: hypothetical protein VGA78_01485 [Gemmatimonadales bacterium]